MKRNVLFCIFAISISLIITSCGVDSESVSQFAPAGTATVSDVTQGNDASSPLDTYKTSLESNKDCSLESTTITDETGDEGVVTTAIVDEKTDKINTTESSKSDISSNNTTHYDTDIRSQVTEVEKTSVSNATVESSDKVNVMQRFSEPTSQRVATQEVLERTSFVSKIDEIKSTYSAEEIISYIDYCGGPNIITPLYALDERYPIDYFVRPVGSAPYCVYKVDNGDKLFVFFNENEESLRDVTYFFLEKEHLTQESFAEISSGSTLADVEAIDRGTQFIDSVNAHSLSKGFTLHMVEGGFIKITYEGGNFNYRSSKLENPSDFIVKEVSYVPNGEAIDIPRIFGNGSVHYTIAEYD